MWVVCRKDGRVASGWVVADGEDRRRRGIHGVGVGWLDPPVSSQPASQTHMDGRARGAWWHGGGWICFAMDRSAAHDFLFCFSLPFFFSSFLSSLLAEASSQRKATSRSQRHPYATPDWRMLAVHPPDRSIAIPAGHPPRYSSAAS